jgi:hypothetical protein
MGRGLLRRLPCSSEVHYGSSLKFSTISVPYDGQVCIWYQDTPPTHSEHCIFVKNMVLLRNFERKTIFRNHVELYPVTGTTCSLLIYTGQVG